MAIPGHQQAAIFVKDLKQTAADAEPLVNIDVPATESVRNVLFDPQSRLLAVSLRTEMGGRLLLVEMATGRQLLERSFPWQVDSLDFSPDGRQLAIALNPTDETSVGDSFVKVLDTSSGEVVFSEALRAARIQRVAFETGMGYLVVSSMPPEQDGVPAVFNVLRLPLLESVRSSPQPIKIGEAFTQNDTGIDIELTTLPGDGGAIKTDEAGVPVVDSGEYLVRISCGVPGELSYEAKTVAPAIDGLLSLERYPIESGGISEIAHIPSADSNKYVTYLKLNVDDESIQPAVAEVLVHRKYRGIQTQKVMLMKIAPVTF